MRRWPASSSSDESALSAPQAVPPSPEPVLPGHARLVLGLAYDGTEFHGFAAQPGLRTVAGVLAGALSQVYGGDVTLTCAGRTDAGVHALAQVVHVDVPLDSLERRSGGAPGPGDEVAGLARSLAKLCGGEIDVWRAAGAPDGFDARRSATARRYRYDIETGGRRDPLGRHRVWHVDTALDLSVMRLAVDALLGEHDFAAFCRRPPHDPTGPVRRRVLDARWTSSDGGDLLRLEIEASAFCHQMVRSIVGALVAVGSGRMRPSDVVALLRSASRVGAPTLAPAQGLCLVAVRYPERLGGTWH